MKLRERLRYVIPRRSCTSLQGPIADLAYACCECSHDQAEFRL